MTRRIAGKIGLVLCSIMITLGLLEVGLRIVLGNSLDFDRVYQAYHPVLGHVHPTGLDVKVPFDEHPQGYFQLTTNNHGLREDAATVYAKPVGLYRILVLGDSHTDGTVFSAETYPNVLERTLQAQGLDVEGLNGGIAAYSAFDELLWFHLYGRFYKPDVVIVGLYVGNDLAEMRGFDQVDITNDGVILVDGAILEPRYGAVKKRLKYFLNRSYVAIILRGALDAMVPEKEISAVERAFRVCRGCFFQSLNQAYQFQHGEVDLRESLQRLENTLTELNQQVEQDGVDLIVMLIPTKRQVEGPESDADKFNRASDVLGLTVEERDFSNVALEEVLNICMRNDIDVLNLLPVLQSEYNQTNQPLYYFTDWHLNPSGHRAVAGAIHNYLEQQELIPKQ